ncbi:hypothetical protein F3Y22_tig00002237pilonHSYRG00018 [Hibiscus syriacus]|uniref:Reverse transcriptase Ty1/copia-type domain-containing protein n=1 Tax=Hibiscus syriacus TaxID=106335 RepID=A0A6A3CXT0_HIBSY|nr:hypothetical protein F3Y22_tig00002237pilonHSYRG00018 [Hibiscus syriacus]
MARTVNPVTEAVFAVKTNGYRRNRPQCSHCHLLGHTKDKYYKLHGYPPGYVSKNRSSNSAITTSNDSLTPQQCQQLIAMLISQLQATSSCDIPSSSINASMQVGFVGTVRFSPTFVLHDVLLVPEFNFNLLSVSALASDSDLSLLFNKTDCLIQDLHHAVKSPAWRDAMNQELQAMESLETWSIVPLPEGKKPIDCKWVYRIKHNTDGSVDRYKTRLVAKGFTQVEGIDFLDTFSPVTKMTSLRLLFTLVVVHGWHLIQLDVNNAFLNGSLDEEVYMRLPLDYKNHLKGSNLFPFEHSLFTKGSGDDFIALLVYVDDIVIAGKNEQLLAMVQAFLQQHFKLKLLEDTGCLGKKPVDWPMIPSLKLSASEGKLLPDPHEYRRLIGRLLYLTNTRPDIVHSVHLLSQFVSTPRMPHLQALKNVLAYIKQTPGLGLFFPADSTLHLISWKSKKQATVSGPLVKQNTVPWLFCDNQASVHLVSNQVFHEITKHIELNCHFVRDKVKDGFLKLFHVRSSIQLPNVFTKTLQPPFHRLFVDKLGLLNIHAVPF